MADFCNFISRFRIYTFSLGFVSGILLLSSNLTLRIYVCREEGKVVIGQAGLLALAPEVGSGEVVRWLAEARAFAAEWAELRAVQQNQLSGTPLRCPLQVGVGGTCS